MNIIEMKSITKDYPLGETVVHALRGVDLSVEEGEFISGHMSVTFSLPSFPPSWCSDRCLFWGPLAYGASLFSVRVFSLQV